MAKEKESERKMLNWNFLAHFGADHFEDYFPFHFNAFNT
jgi:hypothetical protein